MKTHGNKAKPRRPWTEAEESLLCDTYLEMIRLQELGLLGPKKGKGQTSKASLVRLAMARGWWQQHPRHRTDGPRSKGSVEAKLMNLSAVRQEMGLPIVSGYPPLKNMSSSCRRIATERFGKEKE